MRNAEIAAALRELGILYELDGADRFRVLAYREAARTIAQSPVSIEQLAEEGRLTELPNVGKTLAQKIETLIETGSIPSADKLKEKFPATLVEVTRVPGLGAKTARRIYDELGVENLDAAQGGGRAGQDREHSRPRPEDRGEHPRLARGRHRGRRSASGCCSRRSCRSRSEIRGDLMRARGREADRDRRLGAPLGRDLQGPRPDRDDRRPGGARRRRSRHTASRPRLGAAATPRRACSPTRASRSTCGSAPRRTSATCSSTSPARPPTTSSCGSARWRAGSRSASTASPKVEGKKVHKFADEAGVYELLGLPYIEPELREGRGEIEAGDTGELPELVTVDDIRGDLHCHTTLSDGRNSLEEMAEAARARGYAYLAVTDHSASHGFGNDVSAEAAREADRGDPRLERVGARAASACSPAPRSTSAPTARPTTPTSCWPSSTG